MMALSLETLLKEMEFKTPFSEINKDDYLLLQEFLQKEKEYREQTRIKGLLRKSGIKQVKSLSQFDFNFNITIPRREIMEFTSLPWVEESHNLVLIGDTGLGKTHIASSICYDAILKGYGACFITAFDLISNIKKSLNPATRVETYSKIKVLCIDELGYVHYDKDETDLIFQIISKRNELFPTIITTNLPPKNWGRIFTGTTASAVLDRLSYRGKFITFEGRSYRLAKKSRY